MAIIKKQETNKFWQGCGEIWILVHYWQYKWCSCCGVWKFPKKPNMELYMNQQFHSYVYTQKNWKRTGVPPTIETAKPEQARPTTRGSPQIPVPIPHCKGVAVLRVQKTKTPSSWQEAKADAWGRKWKRQYQLLQNCTGLKGKASALGGQGSSWVTRARILTSLSFSLF